jgi:metal-responsive CopG/Arc/MetJ family transcriptional regulator
MKAVQVVLEEDLLDQADRQAKRDKLNRSQLIRAALREYLERVRLRELEDRDREGYEREPIEPGEFDVWDAEQAWPAD